MKNLKTILLVVGILFISSITKAQEKEQKKNETVKYWVSMTCENCKAKVEKNIPFEKGVKDMLVDLETKTVTINYKTKKTSPKKLEKALKDLGFKAELIVAEEKKASKKKKL